MAGVFANLLTAIVTDFQAPQLIFKDLSLPGIFFPNSRTFMDQFQGLWEHCIMGLKVGTVYCQPLPGTRVEKRGER